MLGNEFLALTITGTADFALNAANKKHAVSFIARQSFTAKRIGWRYRKSGTAPTYRFGLQADNAGVPSGTFLTYGDVQPTSSSETWLDVTITDYAITAGVKYWIVVERVSGTIDGSNFMYSCLFSGAETRNPYNLEPYGMGFKTYNGSAWGSENYTMRAYVGDNAANCEVVPISLAENRYIDRTYRYGEKFTPATQMILTHLKFTTAKVGTPTSHLYYLILKTSDKSTIATGTFLTKEAATGNLAILTLELPTPVTLAAGTEYAIVFYVTSGTQYNGYQTPWYANTGGYQLTQSYWGNTACAYRSDNGGTSYYNDTSYDMLVSWTLKPPPPPILVAAKKTAVSGFHCFVEQAINNLRAGGSVIKNPNNNEIFHT